jgi:hypothetical protein
MSRSSFINATLPPPTERIRCLDGTVCLVPAFWRYETLREKVADREAGLSLVCKPSEAAEAARDAQTWLVALGAVVLR